MQKKYISLTRSIIFSSTISLGTLNCAYCLTYLNDGEKSIKYLLDLNSPFIEGLMVSSLSWAILFSAILTYFIIEKL